MKDVDPIHTPCKECVFAEYTNITQTGCALNYIERYKNNNTEILEAYDNDKEFYIINSKKCIGYRENKWFNQFNISAEDSIEDKIHKFNESNSLDFTLIINLKNLTFIDLIDIFDQMSKLELKPKKLILIRFPDPSLEFAYANILALIEKFNLNIQWRIQGMVDDSVTEKEVLQTTITSNSGYRFAFYLNKLNNDLDTMIKIINKKIHEDLGAIKIVSNEDRSLICFSRAVYLYSAHHNIDFLDNEEAYEFYNSW